MIGDDLRKRLALISSLAVTLALAACGHSPAPRSAVAGHPCGRDFYMQCALPKPPASLPGAPHSAYGIDFGWGSVSAAQAKALHATFAFSYLSLDTSKNWTASLVNAYHADGIATLTGWETWANRAQDGYAAGVADAQDAKAQAAALGNTNRAIEFSVDCQCAPSSVLSYFQGVHHVLGSRDDAYGDYAVILYLHQHGVVGNDNFQTYAWSSGQWLPASIAPIEQYLNGSAYDNDRTLRVDYGQSPAPVRLLPVCIHKRESRSACRAAKAKAASDQRATAASARMLRVVDGRLARHSCVRPYRRATCVRSGRLAWTFTHRVRWFTQAASAIEVAN